MARQLRDWQIKALQAWTDNGRKGIISAVTGGGKTVLALEAIRTFPGSTSLVVVPTLALLEQWWVEVAEYFGLSLDEVHMIKSRGRLRRGTVNLAVLNTAATMTQELGDCLLVVDECHKAASPSFSAVLALKPSATLGLSATPERQYDDGLEKVLIPTLGPVLVRYTYREALADGVIVPFRLHNIVFELEEETQVAYDRLTRRLARSIDASGPDAPDTVAIMLKRARVLNMSIARVRLSLRLVARNRGRKILIFHEDIRACDLIYQVLVENGISAGVYHSGLPLRSRADVLTSFRAGNLDVLVTCRALDEGFNVPETEVGIIAASTATRRQRIQRLGRVLRPSSDKHSATVYTLVATKPEIDRLREEEAELEGVAETVWSTE